MNYKASNYIESYQQFERRIYMSEDFKVPTMLSIKQTAKTTGVAECYIRQLVAENEICFVKAGRKYLINLEKFVEYLNTPQTA